MSKNGGAGQKGSKNSESDDKNRISEEEYYIPFGRYVDTEFNEPRSNEEFVGREKQRARFIDHLINAGPYGATLITGRRGVGKTSFVNYCIGEYRRSLFKRFLRSKDMHSRIDFLGIALITVVFLAGSLLLTGLLEIALQAGDQNGFMYLIAVPLALLCFYPVIYGSRLLLLVIGNFFRIYDDPDRPTGLSTTQAAFLSIGIGLASITSLWVIPLFGHPVVGLSLIMLGISASYAFVNIAGYVTQDTDAKPENHSLDLAIRIAATNFVIWVAIALLFYSIAKDRGAETMIGINVACTTFIFAIGVFARTIGYGKQRPIASEYQRSTKRPKQILLALGVASLVATIIAVLWVLLADLGPEQLDKSGISGFGEYALVLGFLVVLLAIVIRIWWGKLSGICNPDIPKRFQPQPMLILFIKAIVSIYAGLQLSVPVLGVLWKLIPYEITYLVSLGDGMASDSAIYSMANLLTVPPPTDIDSPQIAHGVMSDPSVFAHLAGGDLYWIAIVSLLIWLFYFVEYEWVLRPFSQTREDTAVDPGDRATSDDFNSRKSHISKYRVLFRDLARYTFPWHVYNFRFPTLVVTVNIGFDHLTNKQVIEAMLVGLRDQYYRAFLAWNSPVSNLRRFIYLFAMILLVSILAKQWVYSYDPTKNVGKLAKDCIEVDCFNGFSPGPIFKVPEINKIEQWLHLELVPINIAKPPKDLRIWQFVLHENPSRTRASKSPDEEVKGPASPETTTEASAHSGGQTGEAQVNGEGKPKTIAAPSPKHTYTYSLSIRLYHVLILIFVIALNAVISRIGPSIYPYQRNIRQIDALLNGMNGRLTRTRQRESKWGGYFFKQDEINRFEQEQLEPAVVESAFLRILEDMQAGAYMLPGTGSRSFRITKPEITFIFDELDKISGVVQPERRKDSRVIDEIDAMDLERRRCAVLYGLFSDLKRTITSGPARFIFVGGRLLYDEWLVDQAKRQPLLSSIFRNHFYIPALLCDIPIETKHRQNNMIGRHQPAYRTREYLAAQYVKATRKYRYWLRARSSPGGLFGWQAMEQPHFVQEKIIEAAGLDMNAYKATQSLGDDDISPFRVLTATPDKPFISPFITLDENSTEEEIAKSRSWERAIIDDLVAFLSYRSAGNTKRLRELISTMVCPIGSTPVTNDSSLRWETFDSYHVLLLDDDTLYRVRMISDLYRHIMTIFGARIFHEEEKTAISLFYLMDFLFKFHGRGFAWANLERFEELTHMHSAPDLRSVLRRMVEGSTGTIFHRILNGIYAFRFQSGFAKEIDYLSRRSSEEMAAFNFALDESQALKVLLKNQSKANGSNYEKIAGIGELHEYDQEYEEARECYRTAIRLLDRGTERARGVVVSSMTDMETDKFPPSLSWGTARLRLVLQIGMTYELVGDLERAISRYADARVFADVLLEKLIEKPEMLLDTFDDLNSPKNLSILFQPTIAEAWATEKLEIGVDASCNVAELYLSSIRQVLPFVNEDIASPTEMIDSPEHSQFSIVAAGLEIKVGDLYFFKGSQSTTLTFLNEFSTMLKDELLAADLKIELQSTDPRFLLHVISRYLYEHGYVPWEYQNASSHQSCTKELDRHDNYILRAIFHYGLALHDVRRLIWHRIESSSYKLNIRKQSSAVPTFASGPLPTFCYRFASEAMGNLADALFSRVSMIELGLTANRLDFTGNLSEEGFRKHRGAFVETCVKWLSSGDEQCTGDVKYPLKVAYRDQNEESKNNKKLKLGDLSDWVGEWNEDITEEEPRRTRYKGRNPSSVRLLVGLNFLLTSAFFRRNGGEKREGIDELFRVSDTISRVLWNFATLEKLESWSSEIKVKSLSAPAGSNIDIQVKLEEELSSLKHGFGKIGDDLLGPLEGLDFKKYLLELAIFSLRRADRLLFDRHAVEPYLARGDLGDEYTYFVGRTIPAHAFTILCSLGLLLDHFNLSDKDNQYFRNKIRGLLEKWTGHDVNLDVDCADRRELLIEHLMHSVRKNRYPILNRLNAYKILLDTHVLFGEPKDWLGQSQHILEDFGQMTRRYGSAMHFMPVLHGITYALFYVRRVKDWNIHVKDEDADFKDQALRNILQDRTNAARDLQLSKEMHTMGRGFYQNIDDLYFLYDDFNDRTIHHNHSIQMMCGDVRTILLSLVESTPVRLRDLE